MKTSILIPFRNAEKYLKECLDSILNQTESCWEVIAIDDHSEDGSLDLVQSYAEKDSRIHLYSNQGRGIIAALRLAYEKSSGELITRMDADDRMLPTKIKDLKFALIESGKGHVTTALVRYFSDGELGEGYKAYENWLNDIHKSDQGYAQIYKECVIPSPCWMVYREDLDCVGAFDSDTYPEDYDLCFRFYQHDLKIVPVKEVLHEWRDYPERTSRNDLRLKDQSFLKIKTDYFLKLETKTTDSLAIWGAGRKGKELAKILIDAGQDFKWVCNNPEKCGKKIYEKEIFSPEILSEIEFQKVMVAVAQRGAAREISAFLQKRNLEEYKDYYFF